MVKKHSEDSVETPVESFVESANVPAAVAAPVNNVVPKILVRAPRNKVYSFEQWAKLRGKPERHMRGMRAFLGTNVGNKYPLEKWDELFKAY